LKVILAHGKIPLGGKLQTFRRFKMSDETVQDQLGDAFDDEDIDTFKTLMLKHKDGHLYRKDGKCRWLHNAAYEGFLPFVEFLIEEMEVDPNNPMSEVEPEGCIYMAASEGHLEVVRYLLDKGAEINVVISTEIQQRLAEDEGDYPPVVRCQTLLAAVQSDSLELVKLIVEAGADLKASWAGLNGMAMAEGEIADYLRSVGAKKPGE